MTSPAEQRIIDALASIIGNMLIDIADVRGLGLLIRATRKTQGVRMDDLAGSAGVGPVFVRDVEHGKATVQLGRVLKLLKELGIELKADAPPEVAAAYDALKLAGLKPLQSRRSSVSVTAPKASSNAATHPAARARRKGSKA